MTSESKFGSVCRHVSERTEIGYFACAVNAMTVQSRLGQILVSLFGCNGNP